MLKSTLGKLLDFYILYRHTFDEIVVVFLSALFA